MEIDDLKEEIEILKKRINILEKNENRRKAYKDTKIIVKIILIVFIFYGMYKGYDYVVHEIPNMMEEKIKKINPFKKS